MPTIVFWYANPRGEEELELAFEYMSVCTAIHRSPRGRDLGVEECHSESVSDLQKDLLDLNPVVVHFSGHGNEGHLAFQDRIGNLEIADPVAMGELFKILGKEVRCVVLNACYTEPLAKEISKHVECVIGTPSPIADNAARCFAEGFYRGIAYGKSIQESFELGKNNLRLKYRNSPLPVLLGREGVDASKVYIIPTEEVVVPSIESEHAKKEQTRWGGPYREHSTSIGLAIFKGWNKTSGILAKFSYRDGRFQRTEPKEKTINDLQYADHAKKHLEIGYPEILPLIETAQKESIQLANEAEKVIQEFEKIVVENISHSAPSLLGIDDYNATEQKFYYKPNAFAATFGETVWRARGSTKKTFNVDEISKSSVGPGNLERESKFHELRFGPYTIAIGARGELEVLSSKLDSLMSDSRVQELASQYEELELKLRDSELADKLHRAVLAIGQDCKEMPIEGEGACIICARLFADLLGKNNSTMTQERYQLGTELLQLLSEAQISLSDMNDHQVNPQLDRLQYDLGIRGQRILALTARPALRELKIDIQILKQIGKGLIDLKNFRFYIGATYWNQFFSNGNTVLTTINPIIEELRNKIPLDQNSKRQYRDELETTIEELRDIWEVGQSAQFGPELEQLRDYFRVYGSKFQSLANLPNSDIVPSTRQALLEIASKLRTLSTVKGWGLDNIGFDHIDHVKPKIEECLARAKIVLDRSS